MNRLDFIKAHDPNFFRLCKCLMISIFLTALLNGLFYAYVSGQISEVRQQEAEVEQKAAWLQLYAENDVEQALSSIPLAIKKQDIEKQQAMILAGLKECGIQIDSVVSSPPKKEKNAPLSGVKTTLALSGDWENISRGLKLLENSDVLLAVENVSITNEKTLNTSLTYELFCRGGEKEAANAQDS